MTDWCNGQRQPTCIKIAITKWSIGIVTLEVKLHVYVYLSICPWQHLQFWHLQSTIGIVETFSSTWLSGEISKPYINSNIEWFSPVATQCYLHTLLVASKTMTADTGQLNPDNKINGGKSTLARVCNLHSSSVDGIFHEWCSSWLPRGTNNLFKCTCKLQVHAVQGCSCADHSSTALVVPQFMYNHARAC